MTMAAKQTATAAGDGLSPPAAARQSMGRFSLLSLLTNNQTPRASFRSKRQKTDKKNQSKSKTTSECGTSVMSASGRSAVSTGSVASAASNTAVVVDVSFRTRLDSSGIEMRECPLCYDELPTSSYPELIIRCGHRSCAGCMEEYLKIEIGESRIDISCPECKERLHPADIQQLLKNEPAYVSKYEQFMVRRVLVTDPDTRWCPAPDCGYAVIATGCAGCPMLQCQRPGCDTLFCYHCKQKWHPNQTCDAARRERFPAEMRLSISDIQTLARTAEEYKSCPRCKTMINKMDDGSCNHMTCSICGAQFCWLCLKEASDLHYLSPSGCTFWGKKPWSKKKKILWQLGTLIGAPIGIALIAGLSVPVLIFGLPIWTGRKLYQRFKNSNRHKRNIIVTLGTTAALVASPILAGITIAIGVPVMLAYVYGVVPYSLCRGGTCGVKNDAGGFSFDFSGSSSGDENSAGVVRGNEGAFLVANPSIGPSIGENSLQTGSALSASGIQMDRVGLADDQSDTKSASMKNMVGTSITGSIYEPETAPFQQRLEIKAEVSLRPNFNSERKNSVDSQTFSQSDNRSLRSFGPSDNRSHVSFNVDNASMKALAGSISAPKDKDGVSAVIPPQELNFYEVRSKSCMRGDHGSPISNRSVSFAAHDGKSKSKKKHSKRRRGDSTTAADKSDRLSLRSGGSLDAVSNSSGADPTVVCINKRSAVEYEQQEAEATAAAPFQSNIDPIRLDISPTAAKALLTEIEVDKPQQHQASAVLTRQTAPHPAGSVPSSPLADGKLLCNILEDKSLAVV